MEAVSLFNQTVRRVHELETELAAAHERIRNLEIALKAAQRDKRNAMYGRGQLIGLEARAAHNELNTLSEDDVKKMFRQHEEERAAKLAKKWWQFFQR